MNLPFPRVLVADPPWSFKDNLPGPKRGAASHYECTCIEDLFPFLNPFFPTGHRPDVLVCWRVASMQVEALQVIDAWGYEMPTSEFCWVKTNRDGSTATGLGRTVRNAHEIALICKRKGAPGWKALDVVKDHGVRSVLEAGEVSSELEIRAQRLEHSRKPDAFYEAVDRLFHGPVLELFARRQWKSWVCCGDELQVVA